MKIARMVWALAAARVRRWCRAWETDWTVLDTVSVVVLIMLAERLLMP